MPTTYACQDCTKPFNTPQGLHMHRLRVHSGSHAWKGAARKRRITMGIARPVGRPRKTADRRGQGPLTCPVCQKPGFTKSSIRSHFDRQHYGMSTKGIFAEAGVFAKTAPLAPEPTPSTASVAEIILGFKAKRAMLDEFIADLERMAKQ